MKNICIRFLIIIYFLLSNHSILIAQIHAFGSSYILNNYRSDARFVTREPGSGFAIQYVFYDTNKKAIPFIKHFFANINMYEGHIHATNTSAAGAFSEGCEIQLSRMNVCLGWMPISIQIPKKTKRLWLNFGIAFQYNLNTKVRGTLAYLEKNDSTPPGWPYPSHQVYEKITSNKQLEPKRLTFGLTFQGLFEFLHSAKFKVYISYQIIRGCTAEVTPRVNIYSQQHYFGFLYQCKL